MIQATLLHDKINSCSAYLKSKVSVCTWVQSNPEYIPLLFEMGFNNQHPNQYRAAWVIELLLADDPTLIHPQIDYFCAQFSKITHESVKRPYCKIASYLTAAPEVELSWHQQKMLIETALDWLIDPHTKVASKCHALNIIFQLATVFPELALLAEESIEQQYANSSPAFQNSARKFKSRFKR